MWTESGLKVTECGLDHPDGLVPIGGVDEGGADDRPVRMFCTFIVAMDRARDAYVLGHRGLGLFLQVPWASSLASSNWPRPYAGSVSAGVTVQIPKPDAPSPELCTPPQWPRLSIRPSSTAKGTPSPGWMKGRCCAGLRSDRYGFGSRPIPGALPSDESTHCGSP
jgi:hypothetical protein